VRGTFAVDHFLPAAVRPDLATDYDNLVYACATCNTGKADHELPDPAEVLLRNDMRVAEDGTIEGDTPDARRLIRVLGFGRPGVHRVPVAVDWDRCLDGAARHGTLQTADGFSE
jgi:hypothetical protein